MIFGLEDTILLTRIAARKSIELAALAHDGGTVASMTSMMLVDDLNRIQLLLDLASNDLSDIERRLDLLTDVNDDLPDDIVQSYRSGLDDRSRSDEESFQALMVRAIILLGPLREGIALSRTISQGESPLGFSRANNIMKVRGILLQILESPQDTVGPDVRESTRVLAILCSQLLRVHSGRDLTNAEISAVLRALSAYGTGFLRDRLSPLLPDPDRTQLNSFLGDMPFLVSVLIGRAVSNSELSTTFDDRFINNG